MPLTQLKNCYICIYAYLLFWYIKLKYLSTKHLRCTIFKQVKAQQITRETWTFFFIVHFIFVSPLSFTKICFIWCANHISFDQTKEQFPLQKVKGGIEEIKSEEGNRHCNGSVNKKLNCYLLCITFLRWLRPEHNLIKPLVAYLLLVNKFRRLKSTKKCYNIRTRFHNHFLVKIAKYLQPKPFYNPWP